MQTKVTMNRVPQIEFGNGSSSTIGEVCRASGYRRVAVICDGLLRETGILKEPLSSLEIEQIDCEVFDRIEPEPPAALVDEYAKQIRESSFDAIVGIGGGSSLDVAKGVAVMAHNTGSIADFAGVGKVRNNGLSLVLLPTTAGTGSEVTNVAVFSDLNHNKFGVVTPFNIPDVAILDPGLTVGLPPIQTAFTGLDAFSHALESYVGRFNSFLTEPFALQGIEYAANYLQRAYRNGSDIEAREYMLRAAMFGGLSFTNTQTGGAHACAMALGVAAKLPHGLAVTLMLPEVMRYNAEAVPAKFARVASIIDPGLVTGNETSDAANAIIAFKELARSVGIEFGLRRHGVTENVVPKIAELALRNTRIWVNNPRNPSREDVETIIRNSLDAEDEA